jgi:(2Fe-2S) ferredoxin
MVVYPEGLWYTYVDHEDIEEIVQSHLLKDQPVERLLLPKEVGR